MVIKEEVDSYKVITFDHVNDPDSHIKDLFNYIKTLANIGHSFEVVVDPGSSYESTFLIDGDGSDMLGTVKVGTFEEV